MPGLLDPPLKKLDYQCGSQRLALFKLRGESEESVMDISRSKQTWRSTLPLKPRSNRIQKCTLVNFKLQFLFYYRPQRSWGNVMFLHVSVILFTERGVCLSACWYTTPGADTPLWSRHPLGADPPGADPPGADSPPPWEQCMLGDIGKNYLIAVHFEKFH